MFGAINQFSVGVHDYVCIGDAGEDLKEVLTESRR